MNVATAEAFVVENHARVNTRTSRGDRTRDQEVFLRLASSEGTVGWGSAAPKWYLSGETVPGVLAALQERLVPWLLSLPHVPVHGAAARMDRVIRNSPAAKGAVDVALYDLVGHHLGSPVCDVLGGAIDKDRSPFGVVFVGSIEESVDAASGLREIGCSSVKVKVASSPTESLPRLEAIRAALGPDIAIILDPNQSWTAEQCLAHAEALAVLGVVELEQPIDSRDLAALGALTSACPISISVDESIAGHQDAWGLCKTGTVDALTLKVSKVGGIDSCVEIARTAEQFGISCTAGATFQSTLLEAATWHMYLATPNVGRHEVKGLVRDDVATLADPRASILEVPDQPGLGVVVDRERLGPPVFRAEAG